MPLGRLPVMSARPEGARAAPKGSSAGWTFLTNHAHVLLCIAKNPDVRISEIADLVGIGERAAQRIVGDLVDGGYVTRIKVGRRNRYTVEGGRTLRHPLARERKLRQLIEALTDPGVESSLLPSGPAPIPDELAASREP